MAQLLTVLNRELIVPTFAFQEALPNDEGLNVYRNLATAFQSVQASAIPIVNIGTDSNITTAELIIDLINEAYEVSIYLLTYRTQPVYAVSVCIFCVCLYMLCLSVYSVSVCIFCVCLYMMRLFCGIM